MKIVFQDVNFCTRWPCCICHGHTEKHDLYAVARQYDGTEIGFVCEQCIEAGIEGMKKRSLEAAEREVVLAAEYLARAKAFQNEAVVCPTMQAWETAEAEYGRELERELADCKPVAAVAVDAMQNA